MTYLGLAEKVVCEDGEQGTGNSFNCLDILNFPNPGGQVNNKIPDFSKKSGIWMRFFNVFGFLIHIVGKYNSPQQIIYLNLESYTDFYFE
jgi:hypothetical protein